MSFPVHLALPLLSSFIYVAGALLLKRASEQGAGAWKTASAANLATALVFAPLWAWGGPGAPPDLWWQPALVALLFIAGQFFLFLSLQVGDVSVATPVMGVKPVLVALFAAVILGQAPPLRLWMGAGASVLAIALLHGGPATARRRAGPTAAAAVTAAACYAVFDVLEQKWSPIWGPGRFLPIVFILAAAGSPVLAPLLGARGRRLPPGARPWLYGGALLIGIQAVALVTAIARFGDATAINIVYSSRGLWSVIAVWLFAGWLGIRERGLGAAALRRRLAGAALMVLAIVLVLAGRG